MAVAVAPAWLITVPQRKVRFILVRGFRRLSLQLLVPADAGSVVMKITIIAMGTPQRLTTPFEADRQHSRRQELGTRHKL